MVDLAMLQSVSYIAGALGVGVAAIFYILNLRISQRNMRQTLETRQAQLYMSLTAHWNTKEFTKIRLDTLSMEWTDLDDYSKKYNPRNNSEIYASYTTFARSIQVLADLYRKGLIDLSFLSGMMTTDTLNWWARFGSLEKERWEKGSPGWRNSVPFIMELIEYQRGKVPYEFDEKGNWTYMYRMSGKPWVKPEEMKPLLEKFNSRATL